MRTTNLSVFCATATLAIGACAATENELARAQQSYADARYEQTREWLADLEGSVTGMSTAQRARYYFLSGMAAYRLDERNDALHYLALAREVAGEKGLGLKSGQRETLKRALDKLVPEGRTFRARDPSEEDTSGGETGAATSAGGTRSREPETGDAGAASISPADPAPDERGDGALQDS